MPAGSQEGSHCSSEGRRSLPEVKIRLLRIHDRLGGEPVNLTHPVVLQCSTQDTAPVEPREGELPFDVVLLPAGLDHQERVRVGPFGKGEERTIHHALVGALVAVDRRTQQAKVLFLLFVNPVVGDHGELSRQGSHL